MLIAALTLTMLNQQSVALTPANRFGEKWWKDRHEQCVQLTKQGGWDLIFIGDSITHGWENTGRATWDKFYAPRKAANFGFSGDRTEHVLWRMENGEILGLHPKVAIIMIGTNNIGHKSTNPSETAAGVAAIVAKLRTNMPATKILLLGIFPRGADSTDAFRIGTVEATNQFKTLADDTHVFFLDPGQHYMTRDGMLYHSLLPDYLHPNADGYEIWAKAMEPTLKKLMGESG